MLSAKSGRVRKRVRRKESVLLVLLAKTCDDGGGGKVCVHILGLLHEQVLAGTPMSRSEHISAAILTAMFNKSCGTHPGVS